MPFFIPEYESLRIHDMMLSDRVRTRAYQSAIEANVKPGDVVVDVGAGTGILALVAARAGARKVYAIEPTGVIDLARRIAERNGLASRIEFIRARVEETRLPEQADWMLSEWLGVFALQENMLPAGALARDRFLKPGGGMLPETVGLLLAPVENEELYEEKVGRWQRQPYGLDYSDFASCQATDVHVAALGQSSLLSEPALIAELDMRSARDASLVAQASITAIRARVCHGLAGWFRAAFPGDIVLDTGPDHPVTHWAQAFFPVREPLAASRGDRVAVTFAAEPEGAVVHFIWTIAVGGRPPQTGDTRTVRFGSRRGR
jgi:protein arginine N-methyltransferase 1